MKPRCKRSHHLQGQQRSTCKIAYHTSYYGRLHEPFHGEQTYATAIISHRRPMYNVDAPLLIDRESSLPAHRRFRGQGVHMPFRDLGESTISLLSKSISEAKASCQTLSLCLFSMKASCDEDNQNTLISVISARDVRSKRINHQHVWIDKYRIPIT